MDREGLHNKLGAGQRGFSIVELMVAILIGLIILAGVIQVVLTSKSTFLGQEEMSFIQENARYAVDVIGKDIQSAGHWGCTGPDAKVAITALNSAAGALLGVQAVSGYDGTFPTFLQGKVREVSDADATTAAYPDALVVRGAQGTAAGVKAHSGGTIVLDRTLDTADGGVVAIVGEDCRRLSIVRTDEVGDAKLTYSSDGNCAISIKPSLVGTTASCPSVFSAYLPGATVMEYGAKAYFIGDSTILPGQPALKRLVLSGDGVVTEEIALGVEDMQVRFGVQATAGTHYKSADEMGADDWARVRSVQVDMVFRSQTPSTGESSAHAFLGKTYNDRYMRQLITTTFRLRNRV